MSRLSACIVVVVCFVSATFGGSRDALEKSLKTQGKMLLQASYKTKKGMNARGIRFNSTTLKTHELYLRSKSDGSYIFVGSDSTVSGKLKGRLKKSGELFVSKVGGALFIDDRAIELGSGKWDVFWAAASASKPKVQKIDYPERDMADDFMRKDLLKGSVWFASSGDWSLMKHGGGMAATPAELKNAGYERAANPFSVLGSGIGFLSYGVADWINAYAEGRFYFGKPKRGNATHRNAMPTSDMMIAFGQRSTRLVAFGWDRHANEFVLKQREGKNQWRPIWTMKDRRPPVSNWVRIGLEVRNGCVARAWLDGAMVQEIQLGRRILGPFHICCNGQEMEVDDIQASTLPRSAAKGHPVFLPSRQFADKKELSIKVGRRRLVDPKEYGMWARADDTFIRKREKIDDAWYRASIVTRMPLMGDFSYESVPYHEQAGKLQPGAYEFQFLRKDPRNPLDIGKLQLVKSIKFMYIEGGWASRDVKNMGAGNPQFTLRFRRRAKDGNRIAVKVGDNYVPATEPIKGPVHIAIVRRMPQGNSARFPEPWHHNITCKNLTNELFEAAPTDWNWLEGAFRMDMRWACKTQWNFMACGGTGVPALISKRKFSGDQEHEFFTSLRAALAWDAGDDSYKLKPIGILRNKGWYNRHDINFSFCFDGKNLLSGYAVLFGANENGESLLMRKGKVVAESRLRFPQEDAGEKLDLLDIHWLWYHFRVRKYGDLIHVGFGNKTLFEYRDPEPIDGGHIACWSVRNALSFSREISMAERVQYIPDILYVSNDQPSNWRPLLRDAVRVTRTNDKKYSTRVTNRMGSGFFAVRQRFSKPINLRKTPILELPFRPGPGTKVSVHLKIGPKSYFIDIGSPITHMKSLLTTDYEKGEQFRVPVWDRLAIHQKKLCLAKVVPKDGVIRLNLLEHLSGKKLKLTEIAIGNTSNPHYLLAGNGGNLAGSYYDIGEPVFHAE